MLRCQARFSQGFSAVLVGITTPVRPRSVSSKELVVAINYCFQKSKWGRGGGWGRVQLSG